LIELMKIISFITIFLAVAWVNTLITEDLLAQKPVIEWVSIPGGTFIMGSPETEPGRDQDEFQHEVTLKAFKISMYEITFAQYDAFCEATGRKKPDDEGWGRGNRPVINVSWNDAASFARWIGCRLPTEAEWEYACRAGTTTPFNTGNDISTLLANFNGNYPVSTIIKGQYEGKTLPVGSYPPNPWGLYDMHGNVWEWCQDWYGEYKEEPRSNPKGPSSGSFIVRRGGSWYGSEKYCRSANRNFSDPAHTYNFIGFRVVSKR
jgi:formylglycine-generating enzyme